MRTDVLNRVVQGVGEGASIVCGVGVVTSQVRYGIAFRLFSYKINFWNNIDM